MRALGEHVVALDVDVAFGTLPSFLLFLLFDGKQHPDVDDLVKMAADLVQLGRHVISQRRGDFQMVATDRQIHKKPPRLLVDMAAPNAEGGAREIARVEFTMPRLPGNCNPLAMRRAGVAGGAPAGPPATDDDGHAAPQAGRCRAVRR